MKCTLFRKIHVLSTQAINRIRYSFTCMVGFLCFYVDSFCEVLLCRSEDNQRLFSQRRVLCEKSKLRGSVFLFSGDCKPHSNANSDDGNYIHINHAHDYSPSFSVDSPQTMRAPVNSNPSVVEVAFVTRFSDESSGLKARIPAESFAMSNNTCDKAFRCSLVKQKVFDFISNILLRKDVGKNLMRGMFRWGNDVGKTISHKGVDVKAVLRRKTYVSCIRYAATL